MWDARPSRPALDASQERWLVFSLESHLGQPSTANLPADALIDYARVYVLGTALDAGAGGTDAGGAGAGGSMATGGRSGAGGDAGSGGTRGEGGATVAAGAQVGTGARGDSGGATSPTGGSAKGITADQTKSGCSCRLGEGSVKGKELGLAFALLLTLCCRSRR